MVNHVQSENAQKKSLLAQLSTYAQNHKKGICALGAVSIGAPLAYAHSDFLLSIASDLKKYALGPSSLTDLPFYKNLVHFISENPKFSVKLAGSVALVALIFTRVLVPFVNKMAPHLELQSRTFFADCRRNTFPFSLLGLLSS